MSSGLERRRHPRFAVALPLMVRVMEAATLAAATPSSFLPGHETVSCDISTSGIHFTLPQPCTLGSELECVLTLPPDSPFGNLAQIRFKGKVVRVEKRDAGRVGVAAAIEKYVFDHAR